MEWTQFFILILTMGGLFFWNRSEVGADRREMAQVIAADRKDMLNLIRSIELEIKDFHGKLCALEEKNRGK